MEYKGFYQSIKGYILKLKLNDKRFLYISLIAIFFSGCSNKVYYNWYSTQASEKLNEFFKTREFGCNESYVIVTRLNGGRFGLRFGEDNKSELIHDLISSSSRFINLEGCSLPVVFLDELSLYKHEKYTERGLILKGQTIIIDQFDFLIDSSGNIVDQN